MSNLNNHSNARQELSEFQKNIKEVEDTINSRFKELENSKINLSILHSDCIHTLEQIGKTSASNIKTKILAKKLEGEFIVRIEKSFDEWIAQLNKKSTISSEKWSSKYCPRKNREKFVEDYLNQFNRSISALLNQWISENLEREILLYSDHLYKSLCVEFDKLSTFKIFSLDEVVPIHQNCKDKAKYCCSIFKQKQTYNNLLYSGDDNTKRVGFVKGSKLVVLDVFATGLGAGLGTTVGFSAAFGGIMLGIGAGLVLPVIPISLVTGTILGAKAMTKNHSHELEKEIKTKIIEVGCDKTKAALPKVKQNIISWINREVFKGAINCMDDSFACAISQYENKLELLNSKIKTSEAANIEVELKIAKLKDFADKLKKLQSKDDSSSVEFGVG
jgi:hypothetical protein